MADKSLAAHISALEERARTWDTFAEHHRSQLLRKYYVKNISDIPYDTCYADQIYQDYTYAWRTSAQFRMEAEKWQLHLDAINLTQWSDEMEASVLAKK